MSPRIASLATMNWSFLRILEIYKKQTQFKTFLHPQIQKMFVRISHQKCIFTVNRRSFSHTVLMATSFAEVVVNLVMVAATEVVLPEVHA